VWVSRRDPIVNSFSSSQFRNYILKKIHEILEITNDYGGLARSSNNYPINMDVYNFHSYENELKLKSQKSLWILQSLTGKTVPMNVINIDIVDSSERVKQLSARQVEYYYKTFIEPLCIPYRVIRVCCVCIFFCCIQLI
jgi:hypothetical protein